MWKNVEQKYKRTMRFPGLAFLKFAYFFSTYLFSRNTYQYQPQNRTNFCFDRSNRTFSENDLEGSRTM